MVMTSFLWGNISMHKSSVQIKLYDWWNLSLGIRRAKEEPRHCWLRKLVSMLNHAEETHSRFCQEEEKTALHMLCEYIALARLRLVWCGMEKPEDISSIKRSASRLWRLIKEIKQNTKLNGFRRWRCESVKCLK